MSSGSGGQRRHAKRFIAHAGSLAGDERGQASFMMLIFLPFLFLLGLLMVNLTMVVAARSSVRRAADAAALAGCLDLPNVGAAQTSARNYGASSGSLNASSTPNLESGDGGQVLNPDPPVVDNSGATGANGGLLLNNRITVHVQRTQRLIGLPASGFTDQTVKGHAVCGRKEGGSPVMLALHPNGMDTFKINGTTNLNLGTGGLAVNSTCTSGCGGSNEALDVIGGAIIKGNFATTGDGNARVAPSATLKAPLEQGITPDLFASVAEPAVPPAGSCTPSGGGTTCMPGLYSGGLALSGTVTLQSGTYYLAGGGLTINSGATVTGSGVMIFNGDPVGQTGDQCGATSINSNVTFAVSPPQSGPYQYLLFFQSRSCSATVSVTANVTLGLPPTAGNAPCGGLLCGAFYLKGGLFTMGPQSGGAGTLDSVNVIVVADTIDLHGPITFNNPFIPSGSPAHGDIALSE